MSGWQRWKNIMKCYPFEEKRLAKWKPPYILQPKYDGVRCRAIPLDNGEFLLLSSEENIIFSVPHINEQLKSMPRIELDGELYCHGMSFEEIVSRTSRTTNLHPDYKSICFYIFDLVNEDIQCRRTISLSKIPLQSHLYRAPFWMCDSLDDIMRVYDDLINQGYEGIIVRHFEAPYERKRSTWVMKFKPKKEDSYEILGVTEEISIEGTPKDTLGALICKSGDGQTFNVGTGFTGEERKELWNIKGMLSGNTAKVKYQHITSGKNVPRFPVFVEIEWRA
jgi:DNA ligase-1